MHLLAIAGFVTMMQAAALPVVTPPGTSNVIVSPPGAGSAIVSPAVVTTPSDAATTPSTTTTRTTTTPAARTEVMSKSAFGDFAVAGTDAILTKTAEGSFEAIHQVGTLPDFLLQRNAANTVDQEQSGQLNDVLVGVMLSLVPLCVALAIGTNVVGVVTGKAASPGAAVGAVVGVAFGALLGLNNRLIFGLVVDLVATVLAVIAGADIQAFVEPGLTVASFTAPIIGGLIAIVYSIAVLWLTVIWWVQWAWVVVLSSLLGIAVLLAFTPFAAPFGRQLIKRWAGSVIDPLLMLTAIKLGTPFTAHLTSAPTVAQQVATLGFLIVAWQSPGFFVGAIGGSLPWVAEAYAVGRLAARGGRGGGGRDEGGPSTTSAGRTTSASADDMPVATNSPKWQAVPWATPGISGGRGGGNAVHNRLSGGPDKTTD